MYKPTDISYSKIITIQSIKEATHNYTRQEHNESCPVLPYITVSMKSLTFHSVKSVIFTKLESSANQKSVKIANKIDTGSIRNVIPFRIFKIIFLRSTVVDLNATKMGTSCL